MDIKVKIDLTEKEYMRFSFYHQRKEMVWAPLIFGVLCFCMVILQLQRITNLNLVFALCVALIVGVLIFIVGSLISLVKVKNVWKSSIPLRGLYEMTFTDGGIYQVSEIGTANLSYDKFYKVYETKMAFYVYVSSVQAMIVPKRCFENAEDVRTVREFFVRNVDKKKLRLRNGKGV